MGHHMDRRTFVLGAAGLGAAALAGGVLAGCAGAGAAGGASAGSEGAAGGGANAAGAAASSAGNDEAAASSASGKALVAVFSYTGNTLSVAERIREETGADLLRIETSDEWPEDYQAMTAQVQEELEGGYLPPLATTVPNWDEYGVVYLGSPIWWGGLPHVTVSFLQEHSLDGKTVAPFATSGGSGIGGMEADVRDMFPDADMREGLLVHQADLPDALDRVRPWLDGLGLR